MSAGDLLKAHYLTIARVRIPGLPANIQIDPDVPRTEDGNAWQRGVNAQGWPIFAVREDYIPGPFRTLEEVESTFAHEEGHAYEAYLYWRDPNVDWRGKWWSFAKLPGTWQQAAADVGPGMLAGRKHPQELWANAFRAAITDVAHDELAPDPKATRAFFRSLVPEPATPASPTPDPVEVTTMIDLRGTLPRRNWSIGTWSPKTSVTVHWNGPAVDYQANPVNVAIADAQYHISKNWGSPTNPAYGDGIQYHRLYAPDGTVFQTRDDDAVLWHCGSVIGNAQSFAWQVMTGEGQSATAAQLDSLRRDLLALGLPRKAHRDWSATACPGDQLYAFVNSDLGTSAGPRPSTPRLEEDDMFTEADRELLQRVKDILEAREPLVWAARAQRILDVERGDAYNPNRAPVDPRIKKT